MAKVNNEGSNTDAMRAHQMRKKAKGDAVAGREEIDFGLTHALAGGSSELGEVDRSSTGSGDAGVGGPIFDFRLSSCLNARAPEKGKGVSNLQMDSWAGIEQVILPSERNRVLASDVDPQLLFRVVFREKVNLSSVSIRCDQRPSPELFASYATDGLGGSKKSKGEEDADAKSANDEKDPHAEIDPDDFGPPRRIKIFVNQDDADFADCEDLPPVMTVETKLQVKDSDGTIDGDDDAEECTYEKIVTAGPKFQRITSLLIFVEEAAGEKECSFLNNLSLTGYRAVDYHNDYA